MMIASCVCPLDCCTAWGGLATGQAGLAERRQQQAEEAEEAEEMLEGATGNLRVLILGAAGEMARLRDVRQAVVQQAPAEAALQQPSSGLQQPQGLTDECPPPSPPKQQQQQQQQHGGGGGHAERHCSSGTELERGGGRSCCGVSVL